MSWVRWRFARVEGSGSRCARRSLNLGSHREGCARSPRQSLNSPTTGSMTARSRLPGAGSFSRPWTFAIARKSGVLCAARTDRAGLNASSARPGRRQRDRLRRRRQDALLLRQHSRQGDAGQLGRRHGTCRPPIRHCHIWRGQGGSARRRHGGRGGLLLVNGRAAQNSARWQLGGTSAAAVLGADHVHLRQGGQRHAVRDPPRSPALATKDRVRTRAAGDAYAGTRVAGDGSGLNRADRRRDQYRSSGSSGTA